jgi:hypothetical protein
MNVSKWGFAWGIAISCLWLPFLHTLVYAQINALLLLLVALAVLAVTRGFPYSCGALLAFASLFKLFPLAVGLVLGLRNHRILIGLSFVIGVSLLVPGSSKWISTVSRFVIEDMGSPIYLYLKALNPVFVLLYPLLIGAVTALIAITAKDDDYPMLASFAIPAAFLAMPPLGYYHLTLLVFPYVCLIASKECRHWALIGFLFLSAVVLGFPRPGPVSPFVFPITGAMYLALFSLWIAIGMVIFIRSLSSGPVYRN